MRNISEELTGVIIGKSYEIMNRGDNVGNFKADVIIEKKVIVEIKALPRNCRGT